MAGGGVDVQHRPGKAAGAGVALKAGGEVGAEPPHRLVGLHPQAGIEGAAHPGVGEVAGPAVEGVVYVSAFSAESDAPAAVEFVEAYTTMHEGETPNSNAELAYEATQMVIYALQNAEELTREGVRDALASISGLELPSGPLTVGEDRNPIKGGVVMEYDADGVSHFVRSIDPS